MPRLRRVAIRRLALAAAVIAIPAAVWLAWFVYWSPLPSVFVDARQPLTPVYTDIQGRVIAELATGDARSHRPITLKQMGPWLPAITQSLEDQRFRSHSGVDLRATARALVRRRGGGSTITQQFVKMARQRTGRSLFAKFGEALDSLRLEQRWTKDQILEAYLNRLPYGNRLIGPEAAARAYFAKPAAALSQAEVIFLAGLPREPSRLNPWKKPDRAQQQFTRSIRLLQKHQTLSAEDLTSITPPSVEQNRPRNLAPHFIQTVVRPHHRGTIATTLDLDLQRRAEQLVRDHLDTFRRTDISQASLVVMNNAGAEVRALVGSRDYARSQVNGALSFRNSGSTLKPFLYLTGIDRRVFTAATLLPDTADAARDAYQDYDPHNFILNHLGPVRVREALGNSLNVPAVVAVDRVGARTSYQAMEDWGIRFDRPLESAGAGFILGNVGVRLLDLTAAFSSIARGGLASPPRMLSADPMPLRRVASPEAVEIVTDILCDNTARLHSFGPNSALAFPVRVAVKTGTSAGFRDTWTVGFTREHTVGVWVGNFDGSGMNNAASTAAAAPLWRRLIEDLLLTDHPVPEATSRRTTVCAHTGLLPAAAGTETTAELFLTGTEPRTTADDWFDHDGHLLLPKEYAGWCASPDNRRHAVTRPNDAQLSILAPRDGAVFVVDGSLPKTQQQLEIRGNQGNGISWSINDEPITPRADGRILWPLQEGEWRLRAESGEEKTERSFIVRRE